MNKIEKTRKSGERTIIAILVIGIAVYLGFTPLFEKVGGGVAGAVIGSSFGAIFVIVLTMYLLNKQTEIEQESKRGEKIFEEKMKIYYKIFEDTEVMLDDGKISKEDEMKKLPFVMTRLITIGSDEVISSYQEFYGQINEIFEEKPEDIVELTPDQEKGLMRSLSDFANTCRVDLGVSDQAVNAELFKKTTDAIEQSSTLLGNNVLPTDKDGNTEKVVDHAKIELTSGNYLLNRHKKGHIRIYKDGVGDAVKNSKTILREINSELDWGYDKEFFLKEQTRKIGKMFIDRINENQ
mgnify:FL=1